MASSSCWIKEMEWSPPGRDEEVCPKHLPTKTTKNIALLMDEFWPLSGKPFFHVVMKKSYLKPLYAMIIPSVMHSILPSLGLPTFITYRGKKWEMKYNGKSKYVKRLHSGWKDFATENNLKIGDACVFELMAYSRMELTFRVQILRGDIPSQFSCKMDGENADTPTVVESFPAEWLI